MAKRRIKLLIIVAGVGLVLAAKVSTSYAHTLAKDGKISAFLHIAPDDKPQPGKVNDVHFYYNDQDFRFTTEGCDCDVTVKEGEKTLYKGILPAVGVRVGELKVFLPDNNFSYDVIVSGTPKTAGFFQPFKLNFDIDVGNPPPQPVKPKTNYIFIPVIGVVLLAAGLKYYQTVSNRAKIKGQGGENG
jgi:hypothetical protein